MTTRLPIIAAAASVAMTSMLAPAAAQDYTLDPTFGHARLVTGFQPDPAEIDLLAGGPNPVELTDAATGGICFGHYAEAPDYRVFFEAGSGRPLTFAAESDADTVLLINAPDGSWHCADDIFGLDPAIDFAAPLGGQYDIWVGTYDPVEGNHYPEATLVITELAGREPSLQRTFFGMDDRVAIGAPEGPWSMIGLVELEGAICTGTLIGPDIVLTAGHCLVGYDGTSSAPLRFYAGASGDTFAAEARVVNFHVSGAWLQGMAEGSDFAFLQLAEPIGQRLGWMDVGPLSVDESAALVSGQGVMVMQAGYSADLPTVLTANLDCPILGISHQNTISHQCDTLPGDSGSPLFVETASGYRIIGIESRVDFHPDMQFDVNVAMYAGGVVQELRRLQAGAAGAGGKS